MVTEKQQLANKQNALLSTGPVTNQGKINVSKNSIKHGIFTKEVELPESGDLESKEEYLQLLNNLVSCLKPQNQIENLLVEKITVDFWRMRRVIRFESGNINAQIHQIIQDYYSKGRYDTCEINKQLEEKKDVIEWNLSYIDLLKKEEVDFDHPTWEGEDLESDMLEDFYLIAQTIDISEEEMDRLDMRKYTFSAIKDLIAENGYQSKSVISHKLIDIYTEANQELEDDIKELEHRKFMNTQADKSNATLGMLPQREETDKILKYERSIQKPIAQNLFLLKTMQKGY